MRLQYVPDGREFNIKGILHRRLGMTEDYDRVISYSYWDEEVHHWDPREEVDIIRNKPQVSFEITEGSPTLKLSDLPDGEYFKVCTHGEINRKIGVGKDGTFVLNMQDMSIGVYVDCQVIMVNVNSVVIELGL